MGESSHKAMRGAGMDDVIFAGSRQPPGPQHGRSHARPSTMRDRTAPAAFNDADMLEVSRRIERDARLDLPHQRPRRAGARRAAPLRRRLDRRALPGPRAPGPDRRADRRQAAGRAARILEEAAGIAGLHSRRHEAELRLRAAENNLARLEDVIGADRRPARRPEAPGAPGLALPQPVRPISARPRRLAVHLRWTRPRDAAHGRGGRAELTAGRRAHAPPPPKPPPPRRRRATRTRPAAAARGARPSAAAAFQRLTHERDQLDDEERRAREAAQRDLASARRDRRRHRPRAATGSATPTATIARLASESEAMRATPPATTPRRDAGARPKSLAEAETAARLGRGRKLLEARAELAAHGPPAGQAWSAAARAQRASAASSPQSPRHAERRDAEQRRWPRARARQNALATPQAQADAEARRRQARKPRRRHAPRAGARASSARRAEAPRASRCAARARSRSRLTAEVKTLARPARRAGGERLARRWSTR